MRLILIREAGRNKVIMPAMAISEFVGTSCTPLDPIQFDQIDAVALAF
jgi:hypothetical protein